MILSPPSSSLFPYTTLFRSLEIPVTDFELSVRSRNCLRKMNIRTLGDLTRTTEAALLASKNFGETSLSEIKEIDRKSTRLNSSHTVISYAVFCLKKKKYN